MIEKIYIQGEVIEISEKGSWVKGKINDENEIQDLILIKKDLILKSKNNEIHNIQCNRNVDFKKGKYIYVSLNGNELDEIYKSEIEYEKSIKGEQENKEEKVFSYDIPFVIIIVSLSAILTPIFQPILKSFIQAMIDVEPMNNGIIDELFTNIFDINSAFMSLMLYSVTFSTLFSILNIVNQARKPASELEIHNKTKSIQYKNEENIKIKEIEIEKGMSYKISLTKK